MIDEEKCTECEICVKVCPLNAVNPQEGIISEKCCKCGTCVEYCPTNAIELSPAENEVICHSCPVQCSIKEGYMGACGRFVNISGDIRIRRKLIKVNKEAKSLDPVIVSVGAIDSTYPDFKPAPFIVSYKRMGMDTVTAVSGTPLSYCELKILISTDLDLAEEAANVKMEGLTIGKVDTQLYGSKVLSIGGVNTLKKGINGQVAAKTIQKFCNAEEIELNTNGKNLKLKLGEPPTINGQIPEKMRAGCGSAIIGMFAKRLKDVADEVIIIDKDITGILTEHKAGEELGLSWSGITPIGKKSTKGRYFVEESGEGWGGTTVQQPQDAIKSVDWSVAEGNITVFVIDPTGDNYELIELTEKEARKIELNEKAKEIVKLLKENCEDATVSGILIGGAGGSARAGITKDPIKLNEEIKKEEAKLTVCGNQTYILPGGGINFVVDVKDIPKEAITYVPTPAMVVPLEWTLEKGTYENIGGRKEEIKNLEELENEIE